MRITITRSALAALVVTMGVFVYGGTKTVANLVSPGPLDAAQEARAAKPADDPRRMLIKALDEQIRSLREQFKSQTAPLEAQIKALREKFDADLKSLEAQRAALVEQGESPGLKDLNEEEAAQLAALADRERAEIEKIHQRYNEERKTIRQTFQQRRHGLEMGKK